MAAACNRSVRLGVSAAEVRGEHGQLSAPVRAELEVFAARPCCVTVQLTSEGALLAIVRAGYWVTAAASHELDLISEWYGSELLQSASSDGKLTGTALWTAHRQRVAPGYVGTQSSGIGSEQALRLAGGLGITIYGNVSQQRGLVTYIVLALYVTLVLVPEYMKFRRQASLAYMSKRRRPGRSGQPTEADADGTLAEILDMLQRSILASAAFHLGEIESLDHPITRATIVVAWRRSGLAVAETSAHTQLRPVLDNKIRVAIATILIALPPALLTWSAATGTKLQSSISAYYG
jgi:hypothetical protein